MALSHEKFDSAGKASKALKTARSGKAKKEIINQQFSAWREGCGSAIRKFFPQYIDLGLAYPDHVRSEIVAWAEEQSWIPLCGQCGVQKYGARHPHRSHSVIWWLAVAIDGNYSVNVPGQRHWCAPKWLAANLRESDKLVADWSHWLSARFAGVLDEEMEAARVKVAIATAPSQHQKLPPAQVGSVVSTSEHSDGVTLADDLRSVRIAGTEYPLTIYQGKMMDVLLKAQRGGKQFVTKNELCKAIETQSCEPRNSWRKSPLWKTVVKVSGGRCSLDLSKQVPKSS